MSESRKVLKGTVLLTFGQVAGYGLSFARNVILARTLAKADFGLAALFGMTVLLLEIAGRMSLGQQMVQSKHGDSASYQATSQAFQAALAICGAILIASLSHPMAALMKVPHLWWAFASLSVVPLARAFEHLDYFRFQRDLNYLPSVLCDLVPQFLITAAAWPLSVWLGDFRVIIWLMIGKATIGMAMTHSCSKIPYRWAWNPDYVRGMCAFGLPLFFNGLLIFGSQQADQVVVGAFLSLEKLASYALAFSLVTIPGNIFAQVGSSLLLPIFSKAQDDPALFRERYRICSKYAAVTSVLLTLPLIVAGEQFASLVYGAKYAGTGTVMAVLGAAAAVRFLRIVPAIASMAKADTMNQLHSNIWRCLSLPLALVVAWLGGDLPLVAACALTAEIAATIVSVYRLHRRQGVPMLDSAGGAAYVLGFVAIGLAVIRAGGAHWSYAAIGSGTVVLLVGAVGTAWIAFPSAARSVMAALIERNSPRPSTAAN